MIRIVWEFLVKPGKIEEFKEHYGPEGTWATLFRDSEDFQGTMLLADVTESRRFLTVDSWSHAQAFEAFKRDAASLYAEIDRRMSDLTDAERYLGTFEAV